MTIKNTFNPNKSENLLIVEVIILAILIYYDFVFTFPIDNDVPTFLIFFLIIYSSFLFFIYIIERRRIVSLDFRKDFFIYTQSIFSSFFGIVLCLFYLVMNTNELLAYIVCSIPLIFLVLIVIIQIISLVQIQRFLRTYILKGETWDNLDDQTRKDFKQAENSVRTDNIPNAIINITKGLERELKLALFQPFKLEYEKYNDKLNFFEIIKPFNSDDGSDPRQRTYFNFKNYLENKRHLTLGNIPFFLLNLTDNKMGKHTNLFSLFSDFLKDKFAESYGKVIEISKILFNHNFFTVSGIKISDLRNEAAHPQKNLSNNGEFNRSNEILSIDNYITLIKLLSVKPNLLKLILDLKK